MSEPTPAPVTIAPMPPGRIYSQSQEFTAALAAQQDAAQATMARTWAASEQRILAALQEVLDKYAAAKAAGTPVSLAWAFQEARLREALATAQTALVAYTSAAAEVATVAQVSAVTMATTQAVALGTTAVAAAGLSATFVAVDPRALRQMVGFLADGSPLAGLFAQMGPDAIRRAQDVMGHGMLMGRGVGRITRDLRRAINVPRVRAERIVRTESQRVYRETTRQTYAANADVVPSWTWLAKLDSRTCPACMAMDGTEHAATETLDGHPNCRCAMVPRTASWEEILGEEGVGLPDTRPPVRDGQAWFREQPPATQRAVLGDRKFSAFRDGRIDLEDLVVRTESEDWGTMRREATLAEALAQARARR